MTAAAWARRLHTHVYRPSSFDPRFLECVTSDRGCLVPMIRADPPPRSGPVAHYQETSRAAFHSRSVTVARRIMDVIGVRGPMTVDELEEWSGWPHQTVSAAVSGLWHRDKVLYDTGQRRPTRRGRAAIVFGAR